MKSYINDSVDGIFLFLFKINFIFKKIEVINILYIYVYYRILFKEYIIILVMIVLIGKLSV